MCNKEKLVKNTSILIQAAQHLQIPILYTEQVPQKLGKTIPEISVYLENALHFEKASFSCCAEQTFMNALKTLNKKYVVVIGIEAHVCVYQTVRDLLKANYAIEIISDAIASRDIENKKIALERMKDMGATISSTEMLIFDWIKTAEHPKFREISRLVR